MFSKKIVSLLLVVVMMSSIGASLVLAEAEYYDKFSFVEEPIDPFFFDIEFMHELVDENAEIELAWANWVYTAWQWLVTYGHKVHIMAQKHGWAKVCSGTWDAICKIIRDVLEYGTRIYKNGNVEYWIHTVNRHVVEVHGSWNNGIFEVSDAWVRTQ